MKFNFKRISSFSILMLMFIGFLQAEATVAAGKTLFGANCASCHAKNMKSNLTGPALGGVEAKWDTKENLYSWIRRSQTMVAKGHPRAVELWNQFKPTVMTDFPNLKDEEIASILLYIDDVVKNPGGAVVTPVNPAAPEKKSNLWLYGIIAATLVILGIVLRNVVDYMNGLYAQKQGLPYKHKSLFQALTTKGLKSLYTFLAVIIIGYFMVNRSIGLGRQINYEPDQPIKFSHATHAGLNKIDCQYCHDTARKSRHAGIPGSNTCMNCHRAIKNGSKYGTAELTKIYASLGYNPNTNTYIPNYDKYPDDSIKAVYTKWIGDQYVETKNLAALDETGKAVVKQQWDDIVSALTNGQKKRIQGGVEWTRIHNLPDHVYFNHSQHVNIGKVACQTCHGAVEKMEVVTQHAPLSMGWCINCHRTTEVKIGENKYYETYTKLHEEIKAKKRDKVVVADIGGLECQKCHY